MMNKILQILILFISLSLTAQELKISDLKASDLKGKTWFTNNDNDSFLKSDTITMSRIVNKHDNRVKLNEVLFKSNRTKSNLYKEFLFKRNGELKESDFIINQWKRIESKNELTWTFNNDTAVIDFYKSDILYSSFLVIEFNKCHTTLRNSTNKKVSNIFFRVLKLIRIL